MLYSILPSKFICKLTQLFFSNSKEQFTQPFGALAWSDNSSNSAPNAGYRPVCPTTCSEDSGRFLVLAFTYCCRVFLGIPYARNAARTVKTPSFISTVFKSSGFHRQRKPFLVNSLHLLHYKTTNAICLSTITLRLDVDHSNAQWPHLPHAHGVITAGRIYPRQALFIFAISLLILGRFGSFLAKCCQ